MGGGGDADAPAAATPATTEDAPASSAPAKAEASAAPAPVAQAAPEPTPPWVEAAQSRKKIPVWAVPVLALLPIWAVVYALTLDPPTDAAGPLTVGAEVYSGKGCSGCHGASGGGSGNIPALTGDPNVAAVFPKPADQVAWVNLGSAGWLAAGKTELPNGKAVNGGMPAWATSLTPEELMSVILHERAVYGGEAFDAALWEDGFEETVKQLVPDQADAYIAVLDQWKANPPV